MPNTYDNPYIVDEQYVIPIELLGKETSSGKDEDNYHIYNEIHDIKHEYENAKAAIPE